MDVSKGKRRIELQALNLTERERNGPSGGDQNRFRPLQLDYEQEQLGIQPEDEPYVRNDSIHCVDAIIATTSVSNGCGPSLRVRVWVQTEPLPNWRSGSSINPNCRLGYSSMVNSQHISIGRVVSGSHSGSIYRFI
jgi:hypothetical protein